MLQLSVHVSVLQLIKGMHCALQLIQLPSISVNVSHFNTPIVDDEKHILVSMSHRL